MTNMEYVWICSDCANENHYHIDKSQSYGYCFGLCDECQCYKLCAEILLNKASDGTQ